VIITELWHTTRRDKIDSIIEQGIKASVPDQRATKPKGVYLSEYQFNWMWNSTREGKFKGAAIKIDASGLQLIDDFHKDIQDLTYNSKRVGKDYICLADIPPDRILEIWIEVKPNEFHKLEGWK
jgi:hypothetical protein